MIIFNTTYHIENNIHKDWLRFAERYSIPILKKCQGVRLIRMLKLSGLQDEIGTTYAMQCEVEKTTELIELQQELQNIHQEMSQLFGEKVVFFSTELEVVGEF